MNGKTISLVRDYSETVIVLDTGDTVTEQELDQAEVLHLAVHEYGHALIGRLRSSAGTRPPKTAHDKTPEEIAAIWAYEAAHEFRCDLFSNALMGQFATVAPGEGAQARPFTLANLVGEGYRDAFAGLLDDVHPGWADLVHSYWTHQISLDEILGRLIFGTGEVLKLIAHADAVEEAGGDAPLLTGYEDHPAVQRLLVPVWTPIRQVLGYDARPAAPGRLRGRGAAAGSEAGESGICRCAVRTAEIMARGSVHDQGTAVGAAMDEKCTVRVVAIDYKAVLHGPGRAHKGIAELLRWLDQRDVAWVMLTNDPMDAKSALAAAGLPEPALHLCRDDIPDKAKRGNKAWLEAVADRLGLRMNQLILIGTSQFDWYTGLHAGVVHIHARWASRLGAKITSLMSDEPADVIELLEYFLLHEPRWAFRLDDEDRAFAIRSMLPFNARFPRGGGRTFTIKDIFTYENTVKVGDEDARDVLMLHLLCAAYLDGALPGQSFFCVYPSSTPAKGNPQLAGFLQRAKVMTGSSYKEDLLERVVQAPDTSLERYKRSVGQSTGRDISIAAQARTVRVNPAYKKKIVGKTVIVFDDFTTEGKSLEWARTLLSEAGAARVIALTIGKYPSRHTVYQLRPGVTIDPFTTNDITLTHFQTTTGPGGAEEGPSAVLTTAMEHFADAAEGAVELQAPEAAPDRMAHPAPRPVPAGTRSPMTAYKIARQRHLADMLTHLQQHAYPLVWRGEYLVPTGETTTTALWWIALPGQVEQWYDTSEAERLVSGICLAVGIIWEPVAAPGGATQLAEALARMEQRRQA